MDEALLFLTSESAPKINFVTFDVQLAPSNSFCVAASCGKSWVPQPRVIAGADASLGEWPWQAWLHIDHVGFTCGGSLVAREWVVTAAHCILKNDQALYRVTLGDVDRTKVENTEQVFIVYS